MCGIFGVITPGIPLDIEACRRATPALAHRGPDGARRVFGALSNRATLIREQGDETAPFDEADAAKLDWFLGHRRLAILDMGAAAAQPMRNEDGRLWVVFNG